MDPAGIGALIGFGSLFACFLLVYCKDIQQKRKKINISVTFVSMHLLNERAHWKFQNLKLPEPIPTISLSSLSSTTRISATSGFTTI